MFDNIAVFLYTFQMHYHGFHMNVILEKSASHSLAHVFGTRNIGNAVVTAC